MAKSIVGLVVGLLLGVYVTASYPVAAITAFQTIHVPLLPSAHKASVSEPMH